MYSTQIIYHEGKGQYQGVLFKNGVSVSQTAFMMNKALCIKKLNERIESYNFMNNTKIPRVRRDVKEDVIKDEQATLEVKTVTKEIATKVAKPNRRKPFTPYGLKGYLVDNQGNIRLMLNRRACASTIVLEPDMFAMLAEMVSATQSKLGENQ
ncbi:hypothetical protein EV694_1734 [Volucribacter psittacicida]|uniref:Uncharacterized protein n=1 Tax=Volucribacter psittacicida TaxID=203482 RepID=A0A4R1FRJ0_9PAST|nr:hypothetical protein [Volucribacter psittacicida]TCJ96182.1 hypothetical protein EV694_1734 [Volucribacter psittacicida]